MENKLAVSGYIILAIFAVVIGCTGGGSGSSPAVSSGSATIDAAPVNVEPVTPEKQGVKATPDAAPVRRAVKVKTHTAPPPVVSASTASRDAGVEKTVATGTRCETGADQAAIAVHAEANETVLVYLNNALLQAISSSGTQTICKAGPGRYKMIIAANDGSYVSSAVDKDNNNVFEISPGGFLDLGGKVETRSGRIAYDIIGRGFTRISESPVFLAISTIITERCSGNWVGASGITGGNNPNYPIGTEHRLCWNISQIPGDFQLTNIDPTLGAVKGTANGDLVHFWFVGRDLAGTNTVYRETLIATGTRPCNGRNQGVSLNGNDHQEWPPSRYLDAVVSAAASRADCTGNLDEFGGSHHSPQSPAEQ